MSPFIQRIRQLVGNELLLLPSVAVLPRDAEGRLLLVRLIDSGQWATIGGGIEPDESPEEAAVREAQEEARVALQLGRLIGVFGGPEYRVTYPNGDQSAYVPVVFEANVLSGVPSPDGDETSEVGWFHIADLPYSEMGILTRALLRDAGFGPGNS